MPKALLSAHQNRQYRNFWEDDEKCLQPSLFLFIYHNPTIQVKLPEVCPTQWPASLQWRMFCQRVVPPASKSTRPAWPHFCHLRTPEMREILPAGKVPNQRHCRQLAHCKCDEGIWQENAMKLGAKVWSTCSEWWRKPSPNPATGQSTRGVL